MSSLSSGLGSKAVGRKAGSNLPVSALETNGYANMFGSSQEPAVAQGLAWSGKSVGMASGQRMLPGPLPEMICNEMIAYLAHHFNRYGETAQC